MKLRRSRRQPNRSREGAPFFAGVSREHTPLSGTPFFKNADVARQPPEVDDEAASQSADRRDEEPTQSVDDRELGNQTERDEEAVSQNDGEREEEAASQGAGEREDEAPQQGPELEDEAAGQDSAELDEVVPSQDEAELDDKALAQESEEREDITAAQSADRDDESVAQAPSSGAISLSATRSRLPGSAIATRPSPHVARAHDATAAPDIQRTLGDGHDLTASRFAGDLRLEAAFDDERHVRRGDHGDHVVRLQQALVEQGFQLPGAGVDGRFGPETEQAVRNYQAANGLQVDGIVGPRTMGALDRRTFVPSIDWPNSLRDQIRQLIAQGQTYAQIRLAVRGASLFERLFARIDVNFLREIQPNLTWNDFARIVELLGGRAPNGAALVADAAVQAALTDAWNGSNAAVTGWGVDNPAHPQHGACSPSQTNLPTAAQTGTHEEGGWIYMNVITGGIYTRRAPPGAQATVNLNNPPQILDSIVVGAIHTHPNLGACWGVQPGQADRNFSQFVGVPLIARGMQGAATQDFVTTAPAPQRRAHLGGPRGFPMAGGAIAPQPIFCAAQPLSNSEARAS